MNDINMIAASASNSIDGVVESCGKSPASKIERMMTVLEVVQSTTAYLKKRGIESPRLNAEHLLAHALNCKRIELYLEFERSLTEKELVPMRELVRRRGKGEPLQHLLGTVEFAGQVFLCDSRAMVARPETEELVERLMKTTPSPSSILDVGTGSGVIALTLAKQFPDARVHAIDISEDALGLARENANRLNLQARVHFKKADLRQGFESSYDLMVANLPYIATGERSVLSVEVQHDPAVALFGGERGDELVRELIIVACSHLKPNGLLALEIGKGQAEDLIALLTEKNYHDVTVIRDYSGVTRFLFGRYG